MLQEYPTVMEAAVVGVFDRTAGEAVKAFVVLKATTTVQEKRLIDFCRDRIAVYKGPPHCGVRRCLAQKSRGKDPQERAQGKAYPEESLNVIPGFPLLPDQECDTVLFEQGVRF